MSVIINLMSMERALSLDGESLFSIENLRLPESVEPLREHIATLCLARSADMSVVYQDPHILARVMRSLSSTRLHAWGRMSMALSAEYDPLHNYDRTEQHDYVSARTHNLEESSTGSGSLEESGASSSNDSSSSSVTNQVTGVNTNAFSDNDRSRSEASHEASASSSGSSSATTNDSKTASQVEDSMDRKSIRAYGNIGVTTSAQMIEGELSIRKIDICNIIVAELIENLCIGVY